MPDRALLVSPEAPYPLRGGGAMRTAALLHYLASRYRLDGVFFREQGRPDPRDALPPGLLQDSLVIELPFHRRGFAARLLRNTSRFLRGVPPLNDRFSGCEPQIRAFAQGRRWALGVLEHFWVSGYRDSLAGHCDSLILDLHNVESALHRRAAATGGWPESAAHRRFAGCLETLERASLPRFHRVLVASEEDRLLAAACGGRAAVYPNTIPVRETPAEPKRQQIVFAATFEYFPNQSAVAWFARHVWPPLRLRHPELEWVLLGRNPEAVGKWIAGDPRIRATGEVADALPEMARSLVAVVPLRAGSGTRVKILEAWQAGTAVVSTPLGAEGLPAADGKHLLLAGEPAAFAAAVSRLVESEETRHALENAGKRLLSEKFTWPSGWKLLDSLGI